MAIENTAYIMDAYGNQCTVTGAVGAVGRVVEILEEQGFAWNEGMQCYDEGFDATDDEGEPA
jgi:hypothetical protein